ncbi:MAG: YchE family NAAT transporter [Candidatus Latescibacterota bacterium]
MDSWPEYTQFLIGLISIVNPIGSIPIFLGIIGAMSLEDQRRTVFRTSIALWVILTVVQFSGNAILSFFGIGIPSFRVAGGILILLIAISMMHAQLSRTKHTEEESLDAAERNSVAVVPLGIPLLAGPGAISTVIVSASQGTSLFHHLAITLVITLVALTTWGVLRSATFIESLLGRTGINVVMRIMGLIMTAVAVEFIASGLKQIFPVLG